MSGDGGLDTVIACDVLEHEIVHPTHVDLQIVASFEKVGGLVTRG